LELHFLVTRVGMTPLDALRSVTSVTAKRFGWNDRGRIATGLKADLLLVEGDPSNDISELLNIKDVWRDGVRFLGHRNFPLENS
jgi:imidazolonepropionase-like amidohydrolase